MMVLVLRNSISHLKSLLAMVLLTGVCCMLILGNVRVRVDNDIVGHGVVHFDSRRKRTADSK